MRKITSRLPLIGGRLTVSAPALGAKLERISGTPPPWTSVRIPAGTTVTYTATYRGLAPSAGEDDVVVSARFIPDGGDVLSRTATATSVKLELRAVYEAPANPCVNRHVYGVGEKVEFKILPALAVVKMTVVKGDTEDVGDGATVYDTFEECSEVDGAVARVYTCPISSTYTPNITVSCCRAAYVPSMALVEPQEVLTPRAEWDGGCFPTFSVGEAGLYTYNYIGPMHVSFQGIAVSEIPCNEDDIIPPTGYFTNRVASLYHGPAQCSNLAHWIKEGNYWMKDDAYATQPAGENWSPGTLTWKIPVGWHRKNMAGNGFQGVDKPDYERKKSKSSRPLLIGGRRDFYLQTREILSDGTFRSTKFGHWITRGTLCRIILDGDTIQWFKFH